MRMLPHGYRLCVYASDSLITAILSCFTLISVSCLHLGQYKGKFLSSVSLRSLSRDLFPQTGHCNHCSDFRKSYHSIKCVLNLFSYCGLEMPCSFPAWIFFSSHAIFCANVLIVCNPSLSLRTSSGVNPCTWFQYCEPTMCILQIPKYLFKRSKAEEAPPRRQETTEAASFPAILFSLQ